MSAMGRPPQSERDYFDTRVAVQENGCWHWTGNVSPQGYGVANIGATHREGAHRLAYRLMVGPIPAGLTIDHVCHNDDPGCPGGVCMHRRCVNPTHLEPVPVGVNTLRGKTVPATNAAKTHCIRGHEFANTNPTTGWRTCYECMRLAREAKRTPGGKYATHCVNGHDYTPENTRWGRLGRNCKECDRENGRKALERNRLPCRGCGQPKEPGKRAYCIACQQERAA